MDRRIFAASILTAAIGLAGGLAIPANASAAAMTPMTLTMGAMPVTQVADAMPMPTKAQMMKVQEANKTRAMAEHLQKCYGINAIGRNDCAAGAHSCAGQATMARDPASFVLLPAGDCSKIAGGSLKAS